MPRRFLQHPQAPGNRRGFTLVELLVVIAIIGVLIALLLPAVQSAREAARRTQCSNHLRQTALAMLNFESTSKGLPPISEFPVIGPRLYVNLPQGKVGPGASYSWTVPTLPYMEQQSLFDQFDLAAPVDAQVTAGGVEINPQAVQIDTLLCPSDSSEGRAFQSTGTGGLGSQLYNNGRRFAKGNIAAYVSPVHVECLRRYEAAIAERPQRLSKITDGTSNTIVLAEVRTFDNDEDVRGAWALDLPGATLLALDMHMVSPTGGSSATACADPAVKKPDVFSPVQQQSGIDQANTPNSEGTSIRSDWIRACPDSAGAEALGMPCRAGGNYSGFASPRSQHTGGVNAAHVDGSVIWINDDVEPHLFARMICINDGEVQIEGQAKH
ncbi:MAG: DUF1559 domain-containing protein [Planctomycetales bacterium]|nr:DUF1559 domain-containing protein [Planctomycetales bacterium]